MRLPGRLTHEEILLRMKEWVLTEGTALYAVRLPGYLQARRKFTEECDIVFFVERKSCRYICYTRKVQGVWDRDPFQRQPMLWEADPSDLSGDRT